MARLCINSYPCRQSKDATLKQIAKWAFTGVLRRFKRKRKTSQQLLNLPFVDRWLNYRKTQKNLRANMNNEHRKLEIGPGRNRIPGFETVNIVNGPQVDYVCDASKPLPFSDNTFELIYASHILEHIPWYETEAILQEWVRILKPTGALEVWVPDGFKICQVLVDISQGIDNTNYLDGWLVCNPNEDPFLWVAGRLFYGAKDNYPSWHKAIFSAESLRRLFKRVGLEHVREMGANEYRGEYDHGGINLGIKGSKP